MSAAAKSVKSPSTDHAIKIKLALLPKEKTFECLAGTLVVRFFAKDFAEAFEYVRGEISKH
jgi:hypothetical protein